ncbi:hypothetical protein [Methylomonas koyamae]|uniref:hypothetical protein n=1 Tax=Methylomonas koyamae TaxID=702114 RepID=UPI002872CD8D|nr:hypothetical protein [Methylomonas koyamae]WNB77610.1 hypothetical protein RI210_08520 [Methylomonas koyamae]
MNRNLLFKLFMDNSDKSTKSDSNDINTKWFVAFLCLIVAIVFGCYFFNFNDQLSDKNEVWGTFGDYIGGMLNPAMASFAFYLIAKTYELQKDELKKTRELLKVSTIAQEKQLILAALTTSLSSTLTRIGVLSSEKYQIISELDLGLKDVMYKHLKSGNELSDFSSNIINSPVYGGYYLYIERMRDIEIEINGLTNKAKNLENKIEIFMRPD